MAVYVDLHEARRSLRIAHIQMESYFRFIEPSQNEHWENVTDKIW